MNKSILFNKQFSTLFVIEVNYILENIDSSRKMSNDFVYVEG